MEFRELHSWWKEKSQTQSGETRKPRLKTSQYDLPPPAAEWQITVSLPCCPAGEDTLVCVCSSNLCSHSIQAGVWQQRLAYIVAGVYFWARDAGECFPEWWHVAAKSQEFFFILVFRLSWNTPKVFYWIAGRQLNSQDIITILWNSYFKHKRDSDQHLETL